MREEGIESQIGRIVRAKDNGRRRPPCSSPRPRAPPQGEEAFRRTLNCCLVYPRTPPGMASQALHGSTSPLVIPFRDQADTTSTAALTP